MDFQKYLNLGKILTRYWKKNLKQWIKNQYPKITLGRVLFEILYKIIEGKQNLEVMASEERNYK